MGAIPSASSHTAVAIRRFADDARTGSRTTHTPINNMWIKHTDAADTDSPVATTAIRHETLTNGERVAFADTGKAQVTADIGDALCNHYDAIVPVSDEDDDDTDTTNS